MEKRTVHKKWALTQFTYGKFSVYARGTNGILKNIVFMLNWRFNFAKVTVSCLARNGAFDYSENDGFHQEREDGI